MLDGSAIIGLLNGQLLKNGVEGAAGGDRREERLGDTNLTASNPQAEALVGLRSV